MYLTRWKNHQSNFTLDTMEKGGASGHLPGDKPRLGRLSAHRSGSGSDPVTVTRTSSSWTQKVLKPQIAGGWQIILEKNLCILLLFIHSQQCISATIKDTGHSPGQPSLHYIVIMKKRWRRDGSWEQGSIPWLGMPSAGLHIRRRNQNHLNKAVCFPDGKDCLYLALVQ